MTLEEAFSVMKHFKSGEHVTNELLEKAIRIIKEYEART